MNFYDDQSTDGRRAVRAVLSRPRGRDPAADGADHLRQRLDAGRPGDQLRHRVLQLHVQGRVHVPGRHRPADQADARGPARTAASTCASRCDVEKILVARRPRRPACGSTAATSRARAVVSNANLKSHDLQPGRARSTSIRKFRRRGPGRAAEQFELPGLHGAQARRGARREPGRPAVQLHRPAVPHRRCC